MRVLVVFESMFGNGRAVAEAVAGGLRAADPTADVRAVNVLDVPDAPECDLLVVGGPTHMLTLSKPETRASRPQKIDSDEARRRAAGEPGADTGRGVREWLEQLPPAGGTPAAAYDTRVDNPVPVPRRAAAGIAKRLSRAGYDVVRHPEGFHVAGTVGPLQPGELDRAAAWGADLLRRTVPAA